MESKLKKICPNCSQLFELKSNTQQAKSNLPLLLQCGHSMCETCIKNIIKFHEPIECKVCHCDTEVKPSDAAIFSENFNKLKQQFPVNVFMAGEILEEYSNVKQKTSEPEYYINLREIINSVNQGKCLECHNKTTKMCQQCATALCDTCFNKTHKNFVIFKSHLLVNIETLEESNCCAIHNDKLLDYYCKDCKKSICMDCMMVDGENSCKNHSVVLMQEVNESFYEELSLVTPKVDETFKRLTQTAVDIGNLLHNADNDSGTACELTQLVSDVEQNFSKLCAQIQKHKKEVIDIIVKVKSAEKESLYRAKAAVEDAIKKSKEMLNTITSCSEAKRIKQVNLPMLLEKTKKILELPWYLSKEESKSDPIKVKVNEDIISLVTDFVHLEGNTKSLYKLLPTSELGPDVEIPPAPVAPVYPPELPKDVREKPKSHALTSKEILKTASGFYPKGPKHRPKSGSISSLNSLDSESSHRSYVTQHEYHQKPIVQQVQPFEESQQPRQLFEGSQEMIYVTHIIDPHNFFVQRACHQNLVKDMLRDFKHANKLPKPSLNHVSEGKVYLVFNEADSMWQRCRVVSVDRTKKDNPLIHVFCIDFGSTEIVTVNKLRLIPPARLQTPYPLAINCSLANCVPKARSWTSDDSILIQNIIDNKQAVIYIRRILPISNYAVKLDCDVTTFEHGVSIAHALVFHERAKMPNPGLPYSKVSGIEEKPTLFMNNYDYKPESVTEVNVTCIVSPDKFFVRKRHLQEMYEQLCDDMEQVYSLSDNTGSIYLPEIGMVCAVNTEKYRADETTPTWARAVVKELPGRGRVRLLLPDTGHALLAHWTALRRLQQRHSTARALATECYLAGVTPLNRRWSAGAVSLLRSLCGAALSLRVREARRDALGVELRADEELCVNQELVKHKFAISFGLFQFRNDSTEQSKAKKSTHDAPKKVLKHKPSTPTEETHTQDNKDDDLEAKDKGPLRIEAKLLQYQSPSSLYVSLVHQHKVFNELYEEIQKYYGYTETEGREEWAVGDRCCAVYSQSETWRRAVITGLEGSTAQLFFSDFACSASVPLSGLRALAPQFSSIGDAAIRCHLSGVVPAVGNEWPSLTKEYLKELLDAYDRVFITKRGDFQDKSMPVEIWVYHVIPGGALDPDRSEWRCLNDKIIEQGLAIPDKSEQGITKKASEDEENLSFLNITGSVHEWLHLEPMPMEPLNTKSIMENNIPSTSANVSEDSNGMAQEVNDPNNIFISDWLPPEPLKDKEFTGRPTYVDNDCVIYLHDINQKDTLDLIRKALDVRFKHPDPKAKFSKWTVGEPCIAMFYLDNRFYRGRILEVNQEAANCMVHYVDYGNEEVCSFENLRKSIALYQIPVQAHKCVLDRIKPIEGQWDRQTLDYIHKSIVEKQCIVKISGDTNDEPIPIELKYDVLCINDHLVDFEMAEYADGSKAVVRRFAPVKNSELENEPATIECDSGPDYIVEDENETSAERTSVSQEFDIEAMRGKDWNSLINDDEESLEEKCICYPKFTETEFLCQITIINDTKILNLEIIHNDETNLLYEDMFNKLQADGENMSQLNGIFEHKPCVALFHEDGQWYRASILQFSEAKNQIKVLYVDYGNIEVISTSDAREITDEFLILPPGALSVKLNNIEVNEDININLILQDYKDVFLDKGPFTAKVIKWVENLPVIELWNDNNELVYETLITKGVFSLINA